MLDAVRRILMDVVAIVTMQQRARQNRCDCWDRI